MSSRNSYLRAMAAWFCCLLGCLATSRAAETVTVDLGADGGELQYRASGFLYGFSGDGQLPPDEMVVPLKVRLHRTCPFLTWPQAERMKKLGIQQQIVVSDGWTYGKAHPGDNGQWAKWEDFVVHMVKEAQARGLKPQWDIWNEPDHKGFWQRSPEQFNETWRRACLKIRETDPAAVVVGPSWSNVHPGQPRFAEFLRFCKQQQVVPDYICWHFPRDTVKEVAECRRLLKDEKIEVKGIMINEYTTAPEQYAGKTAWLIAQIERAKVDLSCHAIWGGLEKGDLDGILFDARQAVPKGQWWAYQRYGAFSGRLAATTPGNKIDLVAALDQDHKVAQVLFGNSGGAKGDVTVRFQGLDKAPYLREGGAVHVLVERIAEDKAGPVKHLQVVRDDRLSVGENTFDVVIPWTSDRDAFAVRIGPGRH